MAVWSNHIGKKSKNYNYKFIAGKRFRWTVRRRAKKKELGSRFMVVRKIINDLIWIIFTWKSKDTELDSQQHTHRAIRYCTASFREISHFNRFMNCQPNSACEWWCDSTYIWHLLYERLFFSIHLIHISIKIRLCWLIWFLCHKL